MLLGVAQVPLLGVQLALLGVEGGDDVRFGAALARSLDGGEGGRGVRGAPVHHAPGEAAGGRAEARSVCGPLCEQPPVAALQLLQAAQRERLEQPGFVRVQRPGAAVLCFELGARLGGGVADGHDHVVGVRVVRLGDGSVRLPIDAEHAARVQGAPRIAVAGRQNPFQVVHDVAELAFARRTSLSSCAYQPITR